LALLELPEATLADILRLFDEPDFRRRAAGRVANAQVRRFWLREFEGYPARFRAEAVAPLQNKVGAFLADPRLAAILTESRSGFDLRRLMDEGRILLVNLAKGRLGEDAAPSSEPSSSRGRASRPFPAPTSPRPSGGPSSSTSTSSRASRRSRSRPCSPSYGSTAWASCSRTST